MEINCSPPSPKYTAFRQRKNVKFTQEDLSREHSPPPSRLARKQGKARVIDWMRTPNAGRTDRSRETTLSLEIALCQVVVVVLVWVGGAGPEAGLGRGVGG
ncbi:unnamed protein product [Gadus morhua 'NCC']